MVGVLGFSFSGQGQNAALAFVTLKDWSERKGAEPLGRRRIAGRAFGALSGIRDAFIFPLSPPPIPELGVGLRLHLPPAGPRRRRPRRRWSPRATSCWGWPARARCWPQVRPDGLEDAPQLQIDIDRDKAQRAGRELRRDQLARCPRRWVRATSTTSRTAAACSAWWCRPMRRRACSRTTCCGSTRAQPAGQAGAAVGLRHHALDQRARCRPIRYNGYPAMRISGVAAPGYSTGAAMDEMERLAAQLPQGFGYEWTGQSREEKLAGAQAMILLRFRHPGGVPVPGRAVRELVDPAVGDPGGAAGRAGRAAGARCCAATPTTCTSRSGLITIIGLSRQERGADHRVRQGPAGPGQERGRGGAGRGAPAVPPDHHDLDGLRPGRAAAGAGHRRRLGQPARDRHRRDGRHADRHRRWRCSSCRSSSWWCAASSRAANASAACTATSWTDAATGRKEPTHEGAHAPAPAAGGARARRGAAGRLLDDAGLRAAGRAGARRLAVSAAASGGTAASELPWQQFFTDERLRRLIAIALAQQPRPARGDPQHRAGARAIRHPPRRPAAQRGGAGDRFARSQQQRRHHQHLHRRPGVHGLGDRPVRPHRQPERGGAGAVPRHRGGAQGGADQPGRHRGDHLARPGGRRGTDRADAPDAGHARGIAAADANCASTTASPPSWISARPSRWPRPPASPWRS